MNPRPVTASLLHHLVTGSHAEATTRLAVAVIIDHDHHVLLVEADDPTSDFHTCWEPPTDLVLPGETLTDAVQRAAAQAGIDIDRVTGYLGHHDHVPTVDDDTGDVVRVFGFAATTSDPARICRLALGGHQWAALDDLPDTIDTDMLPFIDAAAVSSVPDPPGSLPTALRSHAHGLLADEAATELLIATCWLRRHDFVDHYIDTDADTSMACVDWAAAVTALNTGTLPSSSGEARMLRIAASLADGILIDLHDALTGLDADNLDLITHAMLHTAGH